MGNCWVLALNFGLHIEAYGKETIMHIIFTVISALLPPFLGRLVTETPPWSKLKRTGIAQKKKDRQDIMFFFMIYLNTHIYKKFQLI